MCEPSGTKDGSHASSAGRRGPQKELLRAAAIVSPLPIAIGDERFSSDYFNSQAIQEVGDSFWKGAPSFYIDDDHRFRRIVIGGADSDSKDTGHGQNVCLAGLSRFGMVHGRLRRAKA